MSLQQHSHNQQESEEKELNFSNKFNSFVQKRLKSFLIYSIIVNSFIVIAFLTTTCYISSQGNEISVECKAIPLSCEIRNFEHNLPKK